MSDTAIDPREALIRRIVETFLELLPMQPVAPPVNVNVQFDTQPIVDAIYKARPPRPSPG